MMSSGRRRRVDIRYVPPWRERLPDGSLSSPYGPRTVSAYQKALKRQQNWAWRYEQADPRGDARQVIGYMRGEDGEIRSDVPESEVAVYVAVYEEGRSIRQAAKVANLSRETVRSYLRRLKDRVGAGKEPEQP